MFAEVILTSAYSGFDKVFHYAIPPTLAQKLKVGHQVRIPFGKRMAIGYIVGFTATTVIPNLKEIAEIINETPFFSEDTLDLAKWISKNYFSVFITSLRLLMPPGTKAKEGKA